MWKTALSEQDCSNGPYVCIRHFKDTDYTISKNGLKYYLKKDIFPTLFSNDRKEVVVQISANIQPESVEYLVDIDNTPTDSRDECDQCIELKNEVLLLRQELTKIKCEFSLKEGELIETLKHIQKENSRLKKIQTTNAATIQTLQSELKSKEKESARNIDLKEHQYEVLLISNVP